MLIIQTLCTRLAHKHIHAKALDLHLKKNEQPLQFSLSNTYKRRSFLQEKLKAEINEMCPNEVYWESA